MQAKIRFNGKEVTISDIDKASGFKKFSGLMFKPSSTNALLFSFDSPGKHTIHSLFCKDFLAIWLNEGKVVDYKLVNSTSFSISPSSDFTHLIEVPMNEKYAEVISLFS